MQDRRSQFILGTIYSDSITLVSFLSPLFPLWVVGYSVFCLIYEIAMKQAVEGPK